MSLERNNSEWWKSTAWTFVIQGDAKLLCRFHRPIWKPGISEIAKASRGNAQGGLTAPHITPPPPSCNCQHTDRHCVMAYGHKTQSSMKNGDQQKCLDKALYQGSFSAMFAHGRAPLQLFPVVWIFLRSLCVICYARWVLSEGHKNYIKYWCLMSSQSAFPFLTYLTLMNHGHIIKRM